MIAMTFDTLKTVETLKDAGMSEVQAKALSNIVRDSQTSLETVTKADFRQHKSEIKNDLEKLEMRIDAKFSGVDAKFAGVDAKFAGVDAKFAGVDAKLFSMEERFDSKLSAMKFELLKWTVGIALAQIGIIVGVLVQLLP